MMKELGASEVNNTIRIRTEGINYRMYVCKCVLQIEERNEIMKENKMNDVLKWRVG
jgi:hypothetical protein